MADNSPLYRQVGRKTPTQGVQFSFSGPNILRTTLCTKDRGEWLTQKPVMDQLHEIWLNQATAWLVGDYLFMPDHIHFFCAPRDLRFGVERWFSFWKDCFSKQHEHEEWQWLRGGFHHRIRNAEEFTEKWTYMMENPVRKGLVQDARDWPWTGRVHDIRWT
jgi:putative transposase